VESGDAPGLRAWLAANPQGAGRHRALSALDEAQFALAQKAAGSARNEALRAYLAEFAEGKHRGDAQRSLLEGEVAEAALLEDEARLTALAGAGAAEEAAAARDRARLQRAAARLDAEALAQLQGTEAQELAARVQGADRALVRAAQALFLPRPTSDELPDEGAARVQGLQEWALALDGGRLWPLLAELSSPRAWPSLGALRFAVELGEGLPRVEAKARAERLLASLRPKAHSAPLLVAASVLSEAAGHPAEALEQARAAVAQDSRSLVAGARAAALEAQMGEPAVALLAAQTLIGQAGALAELHGDLARATEDRPADAVALLELCAAAGAAREAEALLGGERLGAEPGAAQARERAVQLAARLEGRVDEAARSGGRREQPGACARLRQAEAGRRSEAVAARRRAAEQVALGGPLALSALERAQRRDPDEQVQRTVAQALLQGPARASAAPPR
jgi:hypothetical protein